MPPVTPDWPPKEEPAKMQKLISWEEHLQRIDQMQGLSRAKKAHLTTGWSHLREVMGEGWLEDAWAARHPWFTGLFWSMSNNAPWVKFHYAQIGYKLRDLSQVPNFIGVLERVRRGDQDMSVMAEVNAGYKLLREGLRFEFHLFSQKKRTPDISVRHDRRNVGVEASVLEQSQNHQIQREIFQRLAREMIPLRMAGGGVIHRTLSKTHAEYVLQQMREALTQARQHDRLIVIEIDNVAEFCFAPKHLTDRVVKWKLAHGMDSKMILKGPDLEGNLGRRLHRKIKQKSKQLPEGPPGIVYLEGVQLSTGPDFSGFRAPFSRADIEEAVYDNPDLLFVALGYSEPLGTLDKLGSTAGMYFSQRNLHGHLSEVSFVVTNKFHRWPRFRHKQLINAFWKR